MSICLDQLHLPHLFQVHLHLQQQFQLQFHQYRSTNQVLIGTLHIPMNSSSCSKQKVDYLLVQGPYKDLHASMKVSIFLNWLGDRSYELINTIEFPLTKSKSVLKDVIEQFDLYFKPSQSTFQSWYELGSLYSSQFKNQNDFLNKLIDVSKDCNLDNPSELVKFLFLVHNQNACVRENLLKDMKPECTLQDCLRIAKLTLRLLRLVPYYLPSSAEH